LDPLILELNARPGLNIQIANRAGLLPRLAKIQTDGRHLGSANKRIAFSKASIGVADSTR
jgi:hypothetical protein